MVPLSTAHGCGRLCAPFYPSLDYQADKALAMARQLNCDSIRYPTFSYVAYFPTQTKLPRHPELGSRDPFRATVELFHEAGMKVVAYNPLNHPFMDVRSENPPYRDWMRYDAEGRPMITRHFGWTRFYEGCLNSPLRARIRLPQNRTVKSISLMWSGEQPDWRARDGWVELTIPSVRIYGVVRVTLS